jgi:hypothetical protein
MKERPILFSAPMVRALLDGSKTQTRRAFSTRMIDLMYVAAHAGEVSYFVDNDELAPNDHSYVADFCPYGQPGDRLWVRETWADLAELSDGNYARQAIYRADDIELYGDEDEPVNVTAPDMRWRPSIFMPRWASRILLEIVSVRVERLQDISEADARAEGVTIEDRHMAGYCAGEFLPPAIRAYRDLWDQINGAGSWDANPWVWVVEFKRVTP